MYWIECEEAQKKLLLIVAGKRTEHERDNIELASHLCCCTDCTAYAIYLARLSHQLNQSRALQNLPL